jgi:hypothetical protein
MLDSLDTLIAFVLIMLVVSLLITIVVQMVSAALNLRGVNLAQALKRTFGVIDPQSEEHAKQLANYILKGRYLSDSFLPDWPIFRWWRHAEAVRPKEVFDAIQRIALGKEPDDYISAWRSWTNRPVINLQDKAVRILQGLGIDSGKITEAQTAIAATGEEASKKLKEFTDAAEVAYKNFDYWTCTCQERAQQWLTMHARILTVFFALIFAFWFQLDAVEIFKLVSSNKAVRDKLVAQAGAASSQAEKLLAESPTILQSAYDTWLRDVKDANIKSALTSPSPPPVKITATDTRENVAGQIENALAKIDNKSKDNALNSFNQAVDKTVTDGLEKKSRDYREVQANFKGTGFDLFPKNPNNTAFTRWGESWRGGCSAHILGIFFSVGLLSLGAPFWYSLLKNLVNLRSQVAQNISSDQQKQKPPDTSAPPPPPMPNPPAPPAQSRNGPAPKPAKQPQPTAPVGGTGTPQAPPTVTPS